MQTIKKYLLFIIFAILLTLAFPAKAGMVTSSYIPNETTLCKQARSDILRWQEKIIKEESKEKPNELLLKKMERVQISYYTKYSSYCDNNSTKKVKSKRTFYRQTNESEGDLNGLESN